VPQQPRSEHSCMHGSPAVPTGHGCAPVTPCFRVLLHDTNVAGCSPRLPFGAASFLIHELYECDHTLLCHTEA
jgi:hypothetical protein